MLCARILSSCTLAIGDWISLSDIQWDNVFVVSIEGISDPELKQLDICFGGRRKFCGGSYVDFGE
jgi:hypothetical protein